MYTTRKGDPYSKLFSTLSLMSCILSQLNIPCSSLVKPYYTKMTIYLFSTFTPYGDFTCSLMYSIFSKWSDPYIQHVQYFISSKNGVFNFHQLDILCTSAVKQILCLKEQFTIHVSPVFHALELIEVRKTCHHVVWTSIWSIPYYEELCNKNCIVKTSETWIICKCVLLHCWIR